ncbi:MAG: hypothetical protein SF182_10760 [Deltaproteobacteria bacterium]|nr:hypothetical protein [Deltaproteobacteria bacterium]
MRAHHLVAALALPCLLAACGDSDSTPRSTPTATVQVPTATPTSGGAPPTLTATATNPPAPTATAVPPSATVTHTVPPTTTPTAADTDTPTATPTRTPVEAGKVIAKRIEDAGELIRGPLADGQVGDWLLANHVARFIIQNAPQRDLYSVGTYGGNLIDAELVGHEGRDNFLEIQPAVQIETVINAQTVEIVNDGSDDSAAIIRTCGPDDVLDFVNPSTIIEDIGGLPFPAAADDQDYEVEGCTEYILEPDVPYLQMVTTLYNNDSVERGFFVGDYINAAGQVEQWASTGKGLGEVLTGNLGVMSYIGFGEAAGVDYAHLTLPIAGAAIPGSSYFTAAGVSYVMQSNSVLGVVLGGPPSFFVPAGGSNSYTRYFAIGDGSGSNATDLEHAVKGLPVGTVRGCVTVGGAPAPQARVAVGHVTDGSIDSVTTIFVTGADGCYRGTLPPGEYGLAGERPGTPYEGGGATPLVHLLSLGEGQTVTQDVALPPTGIVRVTVVDENDQPLPARVSVLGFDPSPKVVFADGTGLFYDQVEALPYGYTHIGYTDSDGTIQFDLEPGSYVLAVSRGVEYSEREVPFEVTQSGSVGEGLISFTAQLARVVDTTGFVSSDYHVHGIASADSRVPEGDRVRQFAGEGVDNIVMTDHHAHTDLTGTIRKLAFERYVHATVGEEVTTWDYGHYNAYPLLVDLARATGGSTDWAGAAPAGREFKAYGAYGLELEAMRDLAEHGPLSTPDTIMQINHIDSTFDPLLIDTKEVPPRMRITPENRLRFRLDPNGPNDYVHFRALELWNGASRGKQSEFLDTRIGVWFNLLNQGLITTAIADTDTHEFLPINAAGARTWTASPTDEPAEIDPADCARAVAAGRAIGGQGAFVTPRLRADDGSGASADLTLEGATTVASSNGKVILEARVQAPIWAPFDRIEIYANATTVVARTRDGVPTLYAAEPSLVLAAGADFTVERVVVDPDVPGAERFEATISVPYTLDRDTWFVVLAKGTDGVSRPMFPVIAGDLNAATNTTVAELTDGNLGEGGVLSLGFSNALYADVDGVPGFTR